MNPLTPSTPTTPTARGNYIGHVHCTKCGNKHWINGECPPSSLRPSCPDAPTATAPGRWGWFSPAEPAVSYSYQHGWRRVRLLEPLRYHAPDGTTHTAPAGLETDGASIPRILAPLAGQRLSGPHLLPAFIHDALCSQGEAVGGAAGLAIRQRADGLFPVMLRACGASRWSAWSKGRAVRIGTLGTRLRGDWRRAGSEDGPPV